MKYIFYKHVDHLVFSMYLKWIFLKQHKKLKTNIGAAVVPSQNCLEIITV